MEETGNKQKLVEESQAKRLMETVAVNGEITLKLIFENSSINMWIGLKFL
jgi:hypothetical protein